MAPEVGERPADTSRKLKLGPPFNPISRKKPQKFNQEADSTSAKQAGPHKLNQEADSTSAGHVGPDKLKSHNSVNFTPKS